MTPRDVIARWLGPTIPTQYESADADSLLAALARAGFAIVPVALVERAAEIVEGAADIEAGHANHETAADWRDLAASLRDAVMQ